MEGASKGDAGKLKEAFHEDARMFGQIDTLRYDMPITDYFDLAAAKPADTGAYRGRVLSVQQAGAEIELRGDDIGGIAVHIAQRAQGLAQPDEILVSRTVIDLVAGSGIRVHRPRHPRAQRGARRLAALRRRS